LPSKIVGRGSDGGPGILRGRLVSRHGSAGFGRLGVLCILAGILPPWNLLMLAKLIEFATNHYVLASLFVVLLIALILNESRRGGRSLSNRELTSLVNSGEGVVLDVRVKKEFDTGHVVDALNIPHDKVVNRVAELEKHRSKTLIVVDAMGQHSGTVCSELKKLGFNAVKLSGGISSWRGDNLPLVK